MAYQNVELQSTELFEELSDTDLTAIVGGTSTIDQVGGLGQRAVEGLGDYLIYVEPFGTTGEVVGDTVKSLG